MLDLALINNEKENLYEVRLLDGTELHIKRPTQAMVEQTLYIQNLAEDEKQADTIVELAHLFTKILNRNLEGKEFKEEKLAEEYDFQTIGFVVGDYFNYWNKEVEERVNFPQDQQD